jgi:aryl-alcohol dehydrogenase-like predicted oxidoreductase
MTASTAPDSTVALGSLQTSRLGLGTWAWGDSLVWGYRKSADADILDAYQSSLAACVTLIDTAELYGFGRSEALIGQFMHQTGTKPTIATKFMPLPWRWREADLLGALRASLRRLGLSQVDLYQIHWPNPPRSVEFWAGALAAAVEAGLTRTVGVSNYDVAQMRSAHAVLAKRGLTLASNQVEYSLIERTPERNGLLAACRELGVTLIAYSPLGMGLLTGKFSPQLPPKGIRGRWFDAAYLARLEPLISKLRECGAEYGKTPAQVALNWTICKGTLPIPGAKNVRQAQDNAGALGWQLRPEQVEALDALSLTVQRSTP